MSEKERRPSDRPWYRWFIGMLCDGTYHFIIPDALETAERFIGKNGGVVFTHAGYMVFASNKRWWNWVDRPYQEKYGDMDGIKPPHIDVPNLDCVFSEKALEWLTNNEVGLKEIGGKYYDFIPKH